MENVFEDFLLRDAEVGVFVVRVRALIMRGIETGWINEAGPKPTSRNGPYFSDSPIAGFNYGGTEAIFEFPSMSRDTAE